MGLYLYIPYSTMDHLQHVSCGRIGSPLRRIKLVDLFCSYPAKSVHLEYSLEKLWEISFPQNSFNQHHHFGNGVQASSIYFELGRMTQTKASDQTRNHLTVVLHKGLQHEIWFSKALVGLSQGWECILLLPQKRTVKIQIYYCIPRYAKSILRY